MGFNLSKNIIFERSKLSEIKLNQSDSNNDIPFKNNFLNISDSEELNLQTKKKLQKIFKNEINKINYKRITNLQLW